MGIYRKNGTLKAKPGPKPGKLKSKEVEFRSRGTGKRKYVDIPTRLRVLDDMEACGLSQTATARKWSRDPAIKKLGKKRITQSEICKWHAKKEEYKRLIEEKKGAVDLRRPTALRFPQLEEALWEWCGRLPKGAILTGPLIVAKAQRLCEAMKISEDELSLSNGWLAGFKKRHGLRRRKINGEAGSVDPKDVAKEQERLRPLLEKYVPEDRFNADETGLYWRQLQRYGLGAHKLSGHKLDKSRISILVASNQTGSEKLPLLFIGKSKSPKAFQNRSPRSHGIEWHYNSAAWMTRAIFEPWLRALDREMGQKGRKILLLLDNFSGHKVNLEGINNIVVEFLGPNLTSHCQPMDAGIIQTLKAHYKTKLLARALDLEEAREPDIFALDILQAIRMIQDAWKDVKEITIAKCWRRTGITNDRDVPTGEIPTIPEVAEPVAETQRAIAALNNAIQSRRGLRALEPRPDIIPPVRVLLAEPPLPAEVLLAITPDPMVPLDDSSYELDEAESNQPSDMDDEPDAQGPNSVIKGPSHYIECLKDISEYIKHRRDEPIFGEIESGVHMLLDFLHREQGDNMEDKSADVPLIIGINSHTNISSSSSESDSVDPIADTAMVTDN